jgi:hypothetical protein
MGNSKNCSVGKRSITLENNFYKASEILQETIKDYNFVNLEEKKLKEEEMEIFSDVD